MDYLLFMRANHTITALLHQHACALCELYNLWVISDEKHSNIIQRCNAINQVISYWLSYRSEVSYSQRPRAKTADQGPVTEQNGNHLKLYIIINVILINFQLTVNTVLLIIVLLTVNIRRFNSNLGTFYNM